MSVQLDPSHDGKDGEPEAEEIIGTWIGPSDTRVEKITKGVHDLYSSLSVRTEIIGHVVTWEIVDIHLWYVHLLLGNDRKTSNIQQPLVSNGFATIELQQRGTAISVRSMPRCYKQDSWSNELVAGQLPVGKNVSSEAEIVVGIRHQVATVEDAADWEDSTCCSELQSVWNSDIAIIACSSELRV
jgi:hypothetical protein